MRFQVKDNNSISALLHLSNSDFLSADFIKLLVDGAKEFTQTKYKIKHSLSNLKRKRCETFQKGKKHLCKVSNQEYILYQNHLISTN